MKFANALLLAEAAMAARLTQHRRENHAKRALARKSHPKIAGSLPSTVINKTNVEYSENWAGAVVISSDISEVTAIITVPTPSAPSGGGGGFGEDEYCASAWVGIDGDTCQTAIVQTGVDFCYEGGEVSYDAWYEWYPDYSYDFDLSVSAGDVLSLTVTATSDTSGTAVIENQTTGESATQDFSGETDGSLCRTNAEWIVEDFEEDDSLVAFADFGTVTFTSASATSGSGTLNPDTATTMDIEQDGEILTSVSVSSNEVTVTYN